jgi:hypothetical protein
LSAVKHFFGVARDIVKFDEEGYAKKKEAQPGDLLLEKYRRKSFSVLLCGGAIVGGLFVCPISWAVSVAVVASQWTRVLVEQQEIITTILAKKEIKAAMEVAREAEKRRICTLLERKMVTQILGKPNATTPNKVDPIVFLHADGFDGHARGYIDEDNQEPQ